MSWDEFTGNVSSVAGKQDELSELRSGYSGVGAWIKSAPNNQIAGHPGFQYSPATGTILVLNFAECIQLTEEYYAPGSLGSFNLQLSVRVQNNHYEMWHSNAYDLAIMPMNSGVFVNERGRHQLYLLKPLDQAGCIGLASTTTLLQL